VHIYIGDKVWYSGSIPWQKDVNGLAGIVVYVDDDYCYIRNDDIDWQERILVVSVKNVTRLFQCKSPPDEWAIEKSTKDIWAMK
jgi:hypothetical protein